MQENLDNLILVYQKMLVNLHLIMHLVSLTGDGMNNLPWFSSSKKYKDK